MPPEVILILTALLLLLIGAYICYSISFKRKRFTLQDPLEGLDSPEYSRFKPRINYMIAELQKREFEEIRIKARDGKHLYARYYHIRDGAPIILKCHGYKSCPMRDFSGGGTNEIDREYNVLLIDQRAHEHSEGKTIAFGIKERFDVLAWTKYLTKRFGKKTKIVLYGISMGASTVLMASALKLPKSVKGVIADCSYSSPKDILIKVATKDMHLPGRLLFPLVWLGGLIFGGFNVTATSAVRSVRKTKLPLLIIHGLDDSFVPHTMSEQIFEAAAPEDKKLLLFRGAAHGISYMLNEDRYTEEMKKFMNRIFK